MGLTNTPSYVPGCLNGPVSTSTAHRTPPLLLAQSGGALLWPHHPTGHPVWLVHQRPSVTDLVDKIDRFLKHYNRSRRPFVWTATGDSILKKIARLCSRVSGTRHEKKSS
jgi:hypothetical protein